MKSVVAGRNLSGCVTVCCIAVFIFMQQLERCFFTETGDGFLFFFLNIYYRTCIWWQPSWQEDVLTGKNKNKPLGFAHHNTALPFLSHSFARTHLSDLLRALTHRLAIHNCVFLCVWERKRETENKTLCALLRSVFLCNFWQAFRTPS